MANSTLIFANNSTDFSYFIAAPSPDPITIPDVDLLDGVRNYVELELYNLATTPVTKVFWDDTANNSLGQEFQQEVNSINDLQVRVTVNQSGFTGNPDTIPLAVIDVNGGGVITGIFDKRPMFFRLGTTINPSANYSWASQLEPTYTVTNTGVTGTFVTGETVTIDGSITATVVTGGTTTITIRLPSSDVFGAGDTIVSASGSATIATVLESFTGADKDISDFREMLAALMTEIKVLKGTDYWYQPNSLSTSGIGQLLNSQLVGITAGARYSWSGTEFTISDDDVTPLNSEVLARIKLFGSNSLLNLTRQDGTGGSTTIPVGDGEIVWLELPATGANRTYSDVGSSVDNYRISAIGSFLVSDKNFWLAYREGSRLYVRNSGELQTGESVEISDPISSQILTFIGAIDETDDSPNYVSTLVVAQSSSLVSAVSQIDAALGLNIVNDNQDRNLTLIKGGTWFWDQVNNSLSWSSSAFLQVPGFADDVNELTAASVSLTADGQVAYFTVKRTAGASTRVINTSSISGLSPTNDTVIFARRVGNNVLVANSFLLKDQERLELDGCLAELNRQLGQLKLYNHETDLDKVRISTTSAVQLDNNNVVSRVIGSKLMDFNGAVINFTTGVITQADGVTALGINFTPQTIPASHYFWYGVSLTPSTVNANNSQVAQVQINLASATNAVLASAPYSDISGSIKLGNVLVQNVAGNIQVQNIIRLGPGSGSGGDVQTFNSIALASSQTNTVISEFTVAHAEYDGLIITFRVKEATSNDIKIGTLYVTTDGTNVGVSETYTETSSTGITFDAAISGANLQVNYSSGANTATMYAEVKRIRTS